MSGALELTHCQSIKWKVDACPGNENSTSPKFRFKNTEYFLKCRIPDPYSYQEICLWLCRETEAANAFVPSCIIVHVENRDTGEILKCLTRIVVKPASSEEKVFWSWSIADIKKLNLSYKYYMPTFIVMFLAEEFGTDEKSVQTSLDINPVPCSEGLSKDLKKLLQSDSDSNADVEFQCGDHRIKAHRSIVSARSPVFARMFQSQMVEGETGVVKIEDLDLDNLRIFIHYLYTGRLDEALTFETAMALYNVADKYEVQSLAMRCAQSLVEGLTVENACDVLDVAERHSDNKFAEEVIIFVLEKKVPLTSENWPAFCSSHPQLAIRIYSRFSEMYLRNTEPKRKRLRC